jgi:predicted amidohydrolase
MLKKGIIKTAQIQMPVITELAVLQAYLDKNISYAAENGADIVLLPEMFCCPYETSQFPLYAEPEGGAVWQLCSDLAAGYHVYLSAGSIPELEESTGNIYNTAYVFDNNGKQAAKHRKMHLFDIDVEGGQYFKESDTLSAGNDITVFDADFACIGLCICYDIRFPELVRLMADKGAEMVIVPAAFNMTTGPAHWELTLKAQAVFNQVYVLGTSSARDMNSSYHSWGHSMVSDPWGNITGSLDEKEGILFSEIDLSAVSRIRQQLPLMKHRRSDVYTLKI